MTKNLQTTTAIAMAIKALESVERHDKRLSKIINELAKIKIDCQLSDRAEEIKIIVNANDQLELDL